MKVTSPTILLRARKPLLLIGLLFLPQSAWAQSDSPEAAVMDKLIECTAIEIETDRLKCYDTIMEEIAGFAETGDSDAAQVFTGTDDWESEPFVMDRPWRVTWQSETDLLTIDLAGPTRLQQQNIVDHQIGEGAGRSEVLEPGEYQLTVSASGEWRVSAVEE